jgi:hypothetical protein
MGRSLEELEMMFTEGKNVRDIVKMSRKPFTSGLMTDHVLEKVAKDEEEYAR